MNQQLSVLIVTFNSGRYISNCLSSLREALRGVRADVTVYDNASTDDTIDRINAFSEVRCVIGAENMGFARACNNLADQSVGDYLLFINPDTVLDSGAIRALLEVSSELPSAGLYGSRTLRPSGEHVPSAQGEMTLWSLFCFASGLSAIFPRGRWTNPEGMPKWDRSTPKTVQMLSGGALLVRRDAWRALGGFDSRYFMYGEDADLCLRARRLGYAPRFVPESLVWHATGGSSGLEEKIILLHKGKVTYIRKNWPRWRAIVGIWFLQWGLALRGLVESVGRIGRHWDRNRGRTGWRGAWKRRSEWRNGWQ